MTSDFFFVIIVSKSLLLFICLNHDRDSRNLGDWNDGTAVDWDADDDDDLFSFAGVDGFFIIIISCY